MRTLISGCSFVEHMLYDRENCNIDGQKFTLAGKSGAGNTAIAANTLFHLTSGQYSDVIVIWSGIRRMDYPVSALYHQSLSRAQDDTWHWWSHISNTVWYHSGGQAGTWVDQKNCPRPVKQSFQAQYTEPSLEYFTDLTCLAVSSVQNFCRCRQIPYKMAFIYDTAAATTKNEHGHGQISSASAYYSLVDWDSIEMATNAYQWCLERNLLSGDEYHPTATGMALYIKSILGIDIADLN